MVLEVATAVAQPPGGTFHCREIPWDYTRIEVGTVKDEYKDYTIDIPIDEGLSLLGQCEGQFILWHKKDIRLNTPSPARQMHQHLLDAVIEDEDIVPKDHAMTEPLQSPGPPEEQHAGQEESASLEQQLPAMETDAR
jgi:hypothetical protein